MLSSEFMNTLDASSNCPSSGARVQAALRARAHGGVALSAPASPGVFLVL